MSIVERDIKVICCGNILASDDGVGPKIAEKLCTLDLPKNVEVIDAGTPGLSIVDMMLGARKVVLVDAMVTGAEPGTIRKIDPDQLLVKGNGLKISLHDISLVEALRIAHEVYPERMPVEVVVIGIEAGSIEKPRIGLTQNVEKALQEAVEMVLIEIKNGLSHR